MYGRRGKSKTLENPEMQLTPWDVKLSMWITLACSHQRQRLLLITFWNWQDLRGLTFNCERNIFTATGANRIVCLTFVRHLATSVKCRNPNSRVCFVWNHSAIFIQCKSIHFRVGLDGAGKLHHHASTDHGDCWYVCAQRSFFRCNCKKKGA